MLMALSTIGVNGEGSGMGDWPVCTRAATFRQWVEALQSIVRERPLEERRKLFHDNAVRFYGI